MLLCNVSNLYLAFVALIVTISILQIDFLHKQRTWILEEKDFKIQREKLLQKEYRFLSRYIFKSFLIVGLYFLLQEEECYIDIEDNIFRLVILFSGIFIFLYLVGRYLWQRVQTKKVIKNRKRVYTYSDMSFIKKCKYKIIIYRVDKKNPVEAVKLVKCIHIYIDKRLFIELSRSELELIILHEIGHFKQSYKYKYFLLYLFATLLISIIIAQYSYNGMSISLVMSAEIVSLLLYFLLNYLIRSSEYSADIYAESNSKQEESMGRTLQKGYKIYKKFPYEYKLYNMFWSPHPSLEQRVRALKNK